MERTCGAFLVTVAKLYRWHKTNKVKDESGEACLHLSQLPALETFSFFISFLLLVKVTYPLFVRSTCQSLIFLRLQCLVELTNSTFVYIDKMTVRASIAFANAKQQSHFIEGGGPKCSS